MYRTHFIQNIISSPLKYIHRILAHWYRNFYHIPILWMAYKSLLFRIGRWFLSSSLLVNISCATAREFIDCNTVSSDYDYSDATDLCIFHIYHKLRLFASKTIFDVINILSRADFNYITIFMDFVHCVQLNSVHSYSYTESAAWRCPLDL